MGTSPTHKITAERYRTLNFVILEKTVSLTEFPLTNAILLPHIHLMVKVIALCLLERRFKLSSAHLESTKDSFTVCLGITLSVLMKWTLDEKSSQTDPCKVGNFFV